MLILMRNITKNKMKFCLFLIFLIFLLYNISALCNSTQVDINSANSTELDKIITVGPATALKIISARPFSSLDDLIRVNGIGNLTLNKIKSQGLACVVDEIINNETAENIATEKKNNTTQTTTQISLPLQNSSSETIQMQTIKIDTQNIKTNNEIENYAIYGFIGFCILLAVLFMLKKREKKNEFR